MLLLAKTHFVHDLKTICHGGMHWNSVWLCHLCVGSKTATWFQNVIQYGEIIDKYHGVSMGL